MARHSEANFAEEPAEATVGYRPHRTFGGFGRCGGGDPRASRPASNPQLEHECRHGRRQAAARQIDGSTCVALDAPSAQSARRAGVDVATRVHPDPAFRGAPTAGRGCPYGVVQVRSYAPGRPAVGVGTSLLTTPNDDLPQLGSREELQEVFLDELGIRIFGVEDVPLLSRSLLATTGMDP